MLVGDGVKFLLAVLLCAGLFMLTEMSMSTDQQKNVPGEHTIR